MRILLLAALLVPSIAAAEGPGDPVTETIQRLLKTPLKQRWSVRKPDEVPSISIDWVRHGTNSTLPRGFFAGPGVRDGNRLIVLAWRHQASFWLLRSNDKGEHWLPSMPLGHLPGVKQYSDLDWNQVVDLIRNDELRIALADKSAILTIPLADLERDTDGDGLTDIHEEMLLLDPETADTDGDGIADNIDSAPHVSATFDAAIPLLAFTHLLEARGDMGPIVIKRPLFLTRLIDVNVESCVVVGDRSLAGEPGDTFRRYLILTPSEAKAARDRMIVDLWIPTQVRAGSKKNRWRLSFWLSTEGASGEVTRTKKGWRFQVDSYYVH